jgi:hypothetical protein
MRTWSRGNLYERRAVVAALCEPRLLKKPSHARAVLTLLDRTTASIAGFAERSRPDYQALRKTLGYGWSVAIAALPEEGKARMEKWMRSEDPEVRWIMRENLSKARLSRLDPKWVKRWRSRLEA